MTLLNWNSLEDVEKIHHFLEFLALVFFVALVVFDLISHLTSFRKRLFETLGLISFALAIVLEICAYPFSTRTDALSSRQLAGAEQKAAEANLNAESAKATQRTLEAELAKQQAVSEQLRAQNLATEGKLEEERATRLQLEQASAPRVIPLIFGAPGHPSTIDPLKPFSGIEVNVEILPDAEAVRAGQEVVNLIQAAGWKVTDVSARPELNMAAFDGVVVSPPYPVNADEFFHSRSKRAAEELVRVLESNRWKARWEYPTQKKEVKPDTITIKIGFKPNQYFDQLLQDKLRKQLEDLKPR